MDESATAGGATEDGARRIPFAEFRSRPGLDDWRGTSAGPEAVFRAGSLAEAAAVVPAVIESAGRFAVAPDIDIRPEALVVRVPVRDDGTLPAGAGGFGAAVSEAAAAAGLRPDPSLVQSVGLYVAEHSASDVRPFFASALGYVPFGDTDAVDPLRRGPALAFNPIRGDRPRRGRTHLDVFVPADQVEGRVEAAIAAGGRLVDDSHAPDWWTLASPDEHGVDLAAWTDR